MAADNRSPRVLESLRGVDLVSVTRRQQVFAGAALNVLVNVVVLNLFVEFADEVVIDSFWISVLTAVLLTAMIGFLARFEHRIHQYFFEKHSWRFAGAVTIWLVLFGGKFAMLEIVNFVFGDVVRRVRIPKPAEPLKIVAIGVLLDDRELPSYGPFLLVREFLGIAMVTEHQQRTWLAQCLLSQRPV